jgi:hypothetical protein
LKKTTELFQSGNKEATQIRDFLLVNNYESVLKQLSGYESYLNKFEKHRDWYDQVVTAIRSQDEAAGGRPKTN